MELRYRQEVTVGTLVIIAVALFIAGSIWLSGRTLGHGEYTHIKFGQVGNLKVGVPVLIAGVHVGKVERIELTAHDSVLVSVSLAESVHPRIDASATIIAISALGDAAISFKPGEAAQPLPRDGVIQGTMQPGLADMAVTLGARADSVLMAAQRILSQQTAKDLQGTLNAMQRMMNMLSQRLPASTEEATRTMASLRSLSDHLDSLIGMPGFAHGLSNLDSVTANLGTLTGQLTHTSASLDTLLAAINHGEGTLGKLASDSGLYNDLRHTLQSVRALTDTIARNPGKVTVQLKVF